MKFKRYIREADMSRRDKIRQMRQDRANRIRQNSMSPIEKVQQEMNEYGKYKSIKNRIKDVLETYDEVNSEVKLYTSSAQDGAELYFPDDILQNYSAYISDSGEHTSFGVEGYSRTPLFYVDGIDKVIAASDMYGGDDADRENALNAFYMFVDNFDEIENWFYDYVEKKLKED